ncbi:PREDICTED: nectin-2 isoform X1 [Nanorana parkeri]|uniref:nectin-2 isoform X1 n=1 Tax=Nanorana parkeri TaxID=125878 RepID=UPI0008546C30|nr:PREDICTED: nectin-2 isoform X1 [Nanorana parkeri]
MRCPLLLLLLGPLYTVIQAQQIYVKETLTGIIDQEAILPCTISSDPNIRVSQIMWEKGGNSIAVYSPQHGTHVSEPNRYQLLEPSPSSATLRILSLRAAEEGDYSCEVTLFPAGNRKATTKLAVIAVPQNSAEANSEALANGEEQTVATCRSSNGRPPSRITWQTSLPGNVTTIMTNGTNGTYTVVSRYVMTPTSQADGMPITCNIDHESAAVPIPLRLSVMYPPEVTVEGYDDNWHLKRNGVFLTCSAKGNPHPTSYTWKTADGSSLPPTVRAKDNMLYVDEVDERVNRSFLCEVTNALGSRAYRQDVLVREHAMQTQTNAGAIAGGVIGVILVLLLLAAIVFIVIKRKGLHSKQDRGTYSPKTRVFGTGKPSQEFTYQDDGELDKPLKGPGPMRDSGLSPSLGEDEDEEERLKYKVLEDDEEDERFNEVGPMLQLRPHPQIGAYLDDDMESQTDGSIISRTAVYV